MARDIPRAAPPLYDRFRFASRSSVYLRPDVETSVRRKIVAARRFVLDERATIEFAEVVRDIPDLILREHQFAKAPFDLCWFELPFPPFYKIVSGQSTDEDGDWQLGYLYDHGTVYAVSGGTVSNPTSAPILMPLAYHLHVPWHLDGEVDFIHTVQTSRCHVLGRDHPQSGTRRSPCIAGRTLLYLIDSAWEGIHRIELF